ncbi:type II secretion system protein M [Sphingomonas sp. SUN019]|uniref:type II secretion system protein M n=1 Tax=Sphingomonas sp. SUN019 TaxID=2937788 RepID=UPI00216402AF|nr:type II secretion system protein M [Sphingomonas sp. SUN019]UVO49374.1 type II secretion system protein M [Sphingomonas sp. SUN019]
MTELRAWFTGRSLRERRLILVMFALLAITIVWAAVIRPVRDGLASSRDAHASAVVRLGETEAQVRALKSIQRSRPQPLDAPLADAIRARADTAGFALASLEPEGDRVRISIASAKPGALLGWIAGLEAEGILVDGVTISGAGPGIVSATMTLKARSA